MARDGYNDLTRGSDGLPKPMEATDATLKDVMERLEDDARQRQEHHRSNKEAMQRIVMLLTEIKVLLGEGGGSTYS